MIRTFATAALAAAALALALASPAMAQNGDLTQARAAGLIGEQADGYLGVVPGANISADLRGRVDQNNMRRRQAYAQSAAQSGVSVNEMAAATACDIFRRPRIAVGERYRNQAGQWRQRTAGAPVEMPTFCG